MCDLVFRGRSEARGIGESNGCFFIGRDTTKENLDQKGTRNVEYRCKLVDEESELFLGLGNSPMVFSVFPLWSKLVARECRKM